jgi:hypothetical protein
MAPRRPRIPPHWHDRAPELQGGDVLRWVLMADSARARHVECFRRTSADGASRGVHPVDAHQLLVEPC